MSIFMNADNTTGNASAKGHENWIELESFFIHGERSVKMNIGQSNCRESSEPILNEIEIVKKPDQSSCFFFDRLTDGKIIPKVTIDFCSTSDELQMHHQYILQNVLITKFSHGSTNGEAFSMEKINLSYTKISKRYTPYDASNKAMSPISTGYNLELAEKM